MALVAIEALLLLVPALIHLAAATDDIVGCGGFVEASPALARLRKASDPKLDYSHITLKLHTLEGLVKDQTQCAPNGYYFLPIYEKGSYLLKVQGPTGWSFTPSQVPVLVDQHGCNGNADINFHYTGFTLAGKVVGAGGPSCKENGAGPAGVTVSVIGPGDSPSNHSVTTGIGGAYEFNNLLIGTYRIEAHHPRLDINVIGSNEVQLRWGMGEVDNIFMIPGYDVEGRVMSKGIPVLGVQVFLHSSDVKDMECPQGPGKSPLSEQALCHATSDVEGRFKFAHVPCGSYNLVPFYKGENTIFGVSPAALDISVAHQSIFVEEGFQVTGFSVGGRVIDSNGHGIAKVKIYIDSVERAITDANGFYKLDQVTSTRYNITAAKEHYQFTSLKDFMVLPNMASIPSIQASQYQLCGSVRVAGQYGRRQVALTHGPSDVKPQTKRVDEDGNFCFEVPPGEYRLSPIATAAEQKTGLLFSPQHLDVVVAAPVVDIVFLQAQVSISGHVMCKSQCSPGISIVLVDTQGGDKIVYQLTDTQNHFKFENVLPGQYKLEVTKEGGLGDDEWCWEQKVVSVDVTSSDIEDIVFVQKGYWLRIKATHPTKAFIVHDNKDPVPLEITSGWQKVCVESPGIHELHFLWACVSFGAPIFSFDTSNPRRINLVAEKYLLSGHIDVYSPLYPGANKLEQKLLVEVWNAKDGKPIANIHAHLFSEANETSPIAVYEYVYWARLGDALSFVPRYARDQNQSEQILLFYPREQNATVAVDGCQPQVPSFAGRPAVYVTGSIVPALEAVNIVITAEKESKIGRLKAGEVAMKVLTGDDGVFAAGPLYDDTQYMVHADKQGYHFKPFGKNSFHCQKLAQILVNIIAGDGAEEILPSVLLSLSGDDGYRKNAVAPPGGKFAFDGMFPGSFYLRPLLKEYSFSPPAQALELLSGATLETTFIARRTAYSIYGRVSSLTGKPEEGVTVEARSVSGLYYEETATDADGKYRLRGLVPNTTYNVKVVVKEEVDGPPRLERASPSVYPVEISTKDTSSINFVAFEHSLATVLSGLVEGSDLEKWQPHISVEVASISEPAKIEREVPLPLSSFFEIQGLPRGQYRLRLVSKMVVQTHKFHSDVLEVDFAKRNDIFLNSVKFYAEEYHHKQDLNAPPVLPVLIGVCVVGLFTAMPSLKDGYQRLVAKDLRRTSQRKRN
ncbi:nodal modulator 1 [Selaginella moellendorffii]|uniref:nodal modulator 1 n=1 Tax=Selaginella moellendorffii TaxID=88036 RepID=UPI000D1C29C4|nr:nodal modulator 1 [Selaginella moellendorffii]|eukprot:XP_002975824.2 nodal modulator 1 [Selaginella moellendorffii]